jgi:hypothetical protein
MGLVKRVEAWKSNDRREMEQFQRSKRKNEVDFAENEECWVVRLQSSTSEMVKDATLLSC